MMLVRDVSQISVSPDGERVVYVVTDRVMTDDKSEYLSQIWLSNSDGTGNVQLTFGETSSVNPQWSYDGKWLAFTSKRGDEKSKTQIFRLRIQGGEAEKLTDEKSDIGDFHWSPDDSQIAFLMIDPKTEEDEKREKAKNDWRWFEEDLKYQRLSLLNVGEKTTRLLTSDNRQVMLMDWSPDGKEIAFLHTKAPGADYWTESDLSLLKLESGEIRLLTTAPGAKSHPFFSPDGKQIATTISDHPTRWAGFANLAVIPASGGEPRLLSETCNGSPNLAGWSEDGKSLIFSENIGTLTQPSSVEIASGETTNYDHGNALQSEFKLNVARTHVGFRRVTNEAPVEAFVTSLKKFNPVQVSRANSEFPGHPVGRTEVIRWKSPDGEEIEGLLTYPVDHTPGHSVPLILNIHGGPAGVFQQGHIASATIYPIAAFSSNGFAVLRPNPRGSTGYGKRFRYANEKDWGGKDYQDLMSGVDHLIASGFADPNRTGVMGWSYGGFMTSWVISQTNRFKAASIGAPVTNLTSFTGTADIPSFLPDYFGAQPWDDPAIYEKHSPVLQMQGATTPALIQHCEGDLRVPISQGYEVYNALKQQGVEVRMLVLPRQDHSPREPRALLKIMQTNLEWMQKHLQ